MVFDFKVDKVGRFVEFRYLMRKKDWGSVAPSGHLCVCCCDLYGLFRCVGSAMFGCMRKGIPVRLKMLRGRGEKNARGFTG